MTSRKKKRVKQVVSLIQMEGSTVLPSESCLEVPGVEDIPEEDGEGQKENGAEENSENKPLCDQNGFASLKASTEKPEDDNKPEEQQKEEFQAIESAEEGEGEESQAVAKEQPSSKQEESEEVLLLPPAPAAQKESEIKETSVAAGGDQ